MSPGNNDEGFHAEPHHRLAKLSTTDMDHVAVVGAGPAGLMLASNLVRFGVKTTIVDDRPDKTSTGRADGLQPKTIETFKQLGLAGPLLQKGARIYDICFWNATDTAPLRRIGREIHYPPGVVDVQDPFILLVHQGMVEEIFLDDLKLRGVEVLRNTLFSRYSTPDQAPESGVEVTVKDQATGELRTLKADFMVGCDGAHSRVRKSMLGSDFDGETSKSVWGVLDGVLETDFPDLWSKAVISSEADGSILVIPREKNMTRLYIELHAGQAPMTSEAATEDFVKERARAIMQPFKIEWKTVEWFGIYKVGQRVARKFADESERIFIAGDAAHSHSPKAAQGMNVSMHDAFNLSWKLNLVIRGLSPRTLLSTYEDERRKVAQDLVDFDLGHANAFAAGDPVALAENFARNIRFISGVGAEYSDNVLNQPEKLPRGGLNPGSLLLPAKVSRYIDANPVNLQLQIPMIGQFRMFFFTHNIKTTTDFLNTVCTAVSTSETVLGRATAKADKSYAKMPQPATEMDEFFQPERYTPTSKLFTYAIVTTMPKARVEISDLPDLLQKSRWTFYLDNLMRMPSCTEKWVGPLMDGEVAIVNVRPDGYVGSIGRWSTFDEGSGSKAVNWLNEYYEGFLSA